MDGLTVVLTATGALSPGTNHIKLAIADAGDYILDSDVFIKAESFVSAAPTIEVDLDVKPTSCPNPINTVDKGDLPVAILGSASLDVNDVDLSSLQLEGVNPIRSNIEDVTAPVSNSQETCDCTTDGADGFDDLTLKFDTQAIVAAFGAVNDGDQVQLTLTGNLKDGTPITGVDCAIVLKKK